MEKSYQEAMFGAGCFWGVEEYFRTLDGVIETAVGYSGGELTNPTYEDVCRSTTGHAEVVYLKFDPEIISYQTLLNSFFELHDPTQFNRQGPDVGPQYRSAVFYYDENQKEQAYATIETLTAEKKFPRAIVTEVTPAQKFYRAEEYHQKYLFKRGLGSCHI